MNIDPRLLYYDFVNEFKRQYYKDLLTSEHLVGTQIKIDKLHYPDGSIEDEANFWGWMFEKNGVKYLLPASDKTGREFKLIDILPIIAKNTIKVATKGIVYHMIEKPVSAKFIPERVLSMKETIDFFSSLNHTNPRHQKLYWFISLASVWDRVNFRISTPAGFGKDSVVDILGSLIGSSSTVENPTLAKLEYLTINKWLCINEIIDIGSEEWKKIEQFLLATGAFKPEVNKHSRAYNNTGEVLDITKLSLSLLYNDIDCYTNYKKYFDFVSKQAVKDRFPALRLYGVIKEDFNSAKNTDKMTYVRENFDTYKKIIYNFVYWKHNYSSYYHGYNCDLLTTNLYERWKINIGRLLRIIDVYCDTQEEFNSWLVTLNESIQDYRDMVKFPEVAEKYALKNKGIDLSGELTFTAKIKKLEVPQSLNSSTTNYTAKDKFW